MNEDRDLTKGKPLSLILSFAFSLIVGNVFQQLYIIVDSIIIGQKVGAKGLSAIGGTDWYIFLVNGFVIGLIQGFSVELSRCATACQGCGTAFCFIQKAVDRLIVTCYC